MWTTQFSFTSAVSIHAVLEGPPYPHWEIKLIKGLPHCLIAVPFTMVSGIPRGALMFPYSGFSGQSASGTPGNRMCHDHY